MSYDRKVKIILHGKLKQLHPDDIEMTGDSVAEVLNGFTRQSKALHPLPGRPRWVLKIPGFDTKEKLFSPIPKDVKEIHLYPQMSGGKGGAFIKIAIGVALVAAAVWLLPATPIIAGFSATWSSVAFNIGLSMVLGGLLELISAAPKADTGSSVGGRDPEASRYLGANQNTVKIGTRIPICYGKVKAYGHYISFDVDSKDVAV